jgi:hypothetical protein
VMRHVPRIFANSTCHCAVSSDCHEPLRIGPPHLNLPGLKIGCLPIDGLRMSTLECYFSDACINDILSHLQYYAAMNGSLPTNFVKSTKPSDYSFTSLNSSIDTKFPSNTSIGDLINNSFIEEWNAKMSYENYFTQCAPKTCRYTYSHRNEITHVLTSLLSFYGGLTLGWRMIIWFMVKKYKKIRERNTIRPFSVEHHHI